MSHFEAAKELVNGFLEALPLSTKYTMYQQYLTNIEARNSEKLTYLKARHGNRSYASYMEKPLEFEKFESIILPFMVINELLDSEYSSWFSELTLEQIAELAGITRERIRQIIDRVTSKLASNKVNSYKEQWEELRETIEQSYISYADNDESLTHLPSME